MHTRLVVLTISLTLAAAAATPPEHSLRRLSPETSCSGGFVGDPDAAPTIEITDAQPGRISGRANNVDTGQARVVLWALTNYWYAQPFIGQEFTPICSDGTWQNTTHQWFRMVALLVDPNSYNPSPGTRFDHPAFEPGVLAWAQVPEARVDLPLTFSDRSWGIKVADCPFDPGPNYFSDSTDSVWVDDEDRLHLRNTFEPARPTCAGTRDRWTSAEIYLLDSLGYGTYTVQLDSPVDHLDPVAVFSPFIYERQDREFDIEFSRALVPAPNNAQYVVQPFTHSGNRSTFLMATVPASTHRMVWSGQAIEFLSWRGLTPYPPDPADVIFQWVYTGPDIPPPGNERMRFNLWLFGGSAPQGGVGDEVIVKSFTYDEP